MCHLLVLGDDISQGVEQEKIARITIIVTNYNMEYHPHILKSNATIMQTQSKIKNITILKWSVLLQMSHFKTWVVPLKMR